MIGQTFSHYRILAELGSGGMGEVYLAEDTRLGRKVALKFLLPELTCNPEALARFRNEARAVADLSHPNIATLFDVDESAGRPFLVLEYLEGRTLRDRIVEGSLPVDDVLRVGMAMAAGLAEAHRHGIVHRDIKSSNVMLTGRGGVKILDFGIARRDEATHITEMGVTLGTVSFMSPEQVRGEEVDARTDIWSLGVVLYEALTGRLPFPGEDKTAVLYSIVHEEATPLLSLREDVPRPLERLITGALRKKREERPQGMQEIQDELRSLDTRKTGWRVRLPILRWRSSRRPRRGALTALTLLLAAGALAAWFELQDRTAIPFEERDWVLIADVENETPDSTFSAPLKAALEVDLQQSRHVNVIDRGQVAQSLRRMRLSQDTRLDHTVARNICRFSGARILLVPRVLSVGNVFDLQVDLFDPLSERRLDSVRATVTGKEAILLDGVDALTRKIRTRLGESVAEIQAYDVPVAMATTSSWEAFRLYCLGYTKWDHRRFQEAEQYFERALEVDPDFVMAEASLALLRIQWLGDSERGKEELTSAVAKSGVVSERERLLLHAAYEQFVRGDLEAAYREYGVITDLYPDLLSAYNNRGMIAQNLGRYEEAVDLFERASKAAPYNAVPLLNLHWTRFHFQRDPVHAEAAIRRALDLDPKEPNYLSALAWCEIAQGHLDEAEENLQRTVALDPTHAHGLSSLGDLLIARHKPREAAAVFERLLALPERDLTTKERVAAQMNLAIALLRTGDTKAAAAKAADAERLSREALAADLARAGGRLRLSQLRCLQGDRDQALTLLDDVVTETLDDPTDLFEAASAAALLEQPERALELLGRAFSAGYDDRFYCLVHPPFVSLRDQPAFEEMIKATS